MAIIDVDEIQLATVLADKDGQAARSRGEPWSSAIAYKIGDYAEYEEIMYRCIRSHPASPSFDPSKWIRCTIEMGDYVDYMLSLLASGVNFSEVISNGV